MGSEEARAALSEVLHTAADLAGYLELLALNLAKAAFEVVLVTEDVLVTEVPLRCSFLSSTKILVR